MRFLKGKVLFTTLLVSGGVAAILLIDQIWLNFLEWDIFIKAIVTIVITSALAGFLIDVDYHTPASREKYMLGIVVLLAVVMGGLIIAQLWLLGT